MKGIEPSDHVAPSLATPRPATPRHATPRKAAQCQRILLVLHVSRRFTSRTYVRISEEGMLLLLALDVKRHSSVVVVAVVVVVPRMLIYRSSPRRLMSEVVTEVLSRQVTSRHVTARPIVVLESRGKCISLRCNYKASRAERLSVSLADESFLRHEGAAGPNTLVNPAGL